MTTENMQPDSQMEQNIPINEGTGAESSRADDESVPVENIAQDDNMTPFEQAVDTAREQANIAADALRRGEFMSGALVDEEANGDDKLIVLLAYATQVLIPLVMPLIILLSESSKKRPFQRYHAVQSLALMLLFMAVGIAAIIGTAIVSIIPLIGWLFGIVVACLTPIAYLMGVIALLYYGYQAYQGKRFAIPGLTSFLRDQGWLKG